jgi:peptidoglycan/xylan/chitin deacetylase (PgdA/CDA1 family)
MLTWNELRQLANSGIEIGSHTISHPFLTEQKSKDAWEEIYKSKLEIERILGLEVQAFSYPNSKHDQSIRDMVRQAGYKLAFGGVSGLNHHDADRYNLYRSCVYNPCPVPEFVFSICTGLHLRERYWNWRKG